VSEPATLHEPSAIDVARVGLAAGARLALARLLGRAGFLIALASIGLATIAGAMERQAARAGAVDRALSSTFGLVIPLLTFALIGLVTGRRRLDDATWPLARFGADRRAVALGMVATAALAAAVLSALAAIATVAAAHGPTSAPLAGDAATSAWIAAATAAAYAGWFALGSTFFRFGGGRVVALATDLFIGDVGLLAAIFPLGLSRNLLGLLAGDLSQRAASVVLVTTGIVASIAAALRCGR
jgi:hypothetical protein